MVYCDVCLSCDIWSSPPPLRTSPARLSSEPGSLLLTAWRWAWPPPRSSGTMRRKMRRWDSWGTWMSTEFNLLKVNLNLIYLQTCAVCVTLFGSVSSVSIPANEVHWLSRPRLRVKSLHWWVAATQTISGILLIWASAPWDCEFRKYLNSYGWS